VTLHTRVGDRPVVEEEDTLEAPALLDCRLALENPGEPSLGMWAPAA